jgi:hypothetical protein
MYRLILVSLFFSRMAAQLPETDLWLFSLKNEKGNIKIETGENVTKRPGYDNQPSFSVDEKKIYYVRIGEDKQADIFTYDPGSKKNEKFISTVESEYSPTYIEANKSINCVVVEKDSTQRIWTYDERTGKQGAILFNEDSVGYFTFLNADTVLYYKLTSPHSLLAYSIKNNSSVYLASSIVRGFKAINRHEFIYGIKDSNKVTFYRYDFVIRKAKKYCEYPSTSEDIIWHQEWGLLKSEAATILRFDEKENKWNTLFDLGSFGIKKITRFIFDGKNKKLVVVDNT